MEVTEAPVSATQAEALEALCAEVWRTHASGQADAAAVRGGLAVARELTDRFRAGAPPAVRRPQSPWRAFLVRRPDDGSSLLFEEGESGAALEFRVLGLGLFTGGALRGAGATAGRLVAFRVEERGNARALVTYDGERQSEADLGSIRLPKWGREGKKGGASGGWPRGASLGGLLADAVAPAPGQPPTGSRAPSATPTGAEWHLVVTSGPALGARFPLVDRAVVGRVAASTIRLESRSVSRRHAEFRRTETGWAVADLGSSNGTWVNDVRVQEPTVLRRGDRVRVGDVVVVVEEAGTPAPTADAVTAFDLPVQRAWTTACPRCGCKLEPGASSCPTCGARSS